MSEQALRRLLIPIRRAQSAPSLLELAEALIGRGQGSGEVLGVVEMGAEQSVSQNVVMARHYRTLLQRITDLEQQARVGLEVQVRVAYNLAQGVREAVIENQANTIILDWGGLRGRKPLDPDLEDLVANPPTDLLLVKSGREKLLTEGVLVPIRGGPSADLALYVGQRMALNRKTHLTVLHVHNAPGDADSGAEEAWLQLRQRLDTFQDVELRLVELEAIEPQRAIQEYGQEHALVVLGAYADAIRSPTLVGSRLARTVQQLPGTVILAKKMAPLPPTGLPE
ncbi:MAG: hypothetical protein ACREP9_18520, partial [Candidatus Dormibacteraceae bacterium]